MIPADLWNRLRALDRRCDLEFHRLDTAEGGHRFMTGGYFPRMWWVVIRDQIGEDWRAVPADVPRPANPLHLALNVAERTRWADG